MNAEQIRVNPDGSVNFGRGVIGPSLKDQQRSNTSSNRIHRFGFTLPLIAGAGSILASSCGDQTGTPLDIRQDPTACSIREVDGITGPKLIGENYLLNEFSRKVTALSPDGRTATFERGKPGINIEDQTDGYTDEIEIKTPIWGVAWAPDGKSLAFAHQDEEGISIDQLYYHKRQYFLKSEDFTSIGNPPDGANLLEMQYTPDGQGILYKFCKAR